jgi:hypothetical protein
VSKASRFADGSVGLVVQFRALAASVSQDAEVVGALDISPREQDGKEHRKTYESAVIDVECNSSRRHWNVPSATLKNG